MIHPPISSSRLSQENPGRFSATTSLNGLRRRLMSTTSLAGRAVLAGMMAAAPITLAHAAPRDGIVVAGDATIARPDDFQTNVHQDSDRAIINWQDFSIGEQETVSFFQPSSNSITLNRVIGDLGSEILGQLNANGRVLIINPNGILFGASSRVDVAGLVATTSDISDANFMAGNMVFDQASSKGGHIVNAGSITARDHGLVAFVAPGVENSGTITARLGQVTLASGTRFTLDLYGDDLIQLAVGDGSEGADVFSASGDSRFIEQSGSIFADGGVVTIDARSAAGVVENIVNMSGVIEARSVAEVGGRIIIQGGDNSDVTIAGRLVADQSHDDGDGGTILVAGGAVSASGTANFSANARETGDGGDIRIIGTESLEFGGSASALGGRAGGNGGFIETSGAVLRVDETARVDTSAYMGNFGLWSLDPEILNVVETVSGDSDVAAATIVSQLETTNVELSASETINIDAAIDSSSQSSTTTLSITDEDDNGNLTINLNAEITLGGNQTLTGDGTTVNLANGTSIQNGVDVAATGATINVAAGTYAVSETIEIDKSVTLLGAQAGVNTWLSSGMRTAGSGEETIIDGGGSLSTLVRIAADDVTLSGFEIRNGTGDLVETDVAVDGLLISYNLIHGSSGDEGIQIRNASSPIIEFNRVYDVAGDGINFTSTTNGIIRENEVHDSASINAAIYINEASTDSAVENNYVHGVTVNDAIKIGNGDGSNENLSGGSVTGNVVEDVAEDGIAIYMSDVVVSGNTVSGSTSENGAIFVDFDVNNVSITGNTLQNNGYDGDGNTTYGVRVGKDQDPTNVTVSGNIFSGNEAQLFDKNGAASLSTTIANNSFDAAVTVTDGNAVWSSIQDGVDNVAADGLVTIAEGAYSEDVEINSSNITLSGVQSGVDARGRSGDEAVLTGSINIVGDADGTTVDGLTIAEGSSATTENTGLFIASGATDITIQNTIFSRSGNVDGDTYRGIVTASNGGHTGLLIQNNSFSGWATGVFLNPGATNAQVLNNDFDGNFVGMSIDGPDGTVVTGNDFSNNLFEGLGLGPGATIPTVSVTDNDFTSNTAHIGLYTGDGTEFASVPTVSAVCWRAT